MSDLDVDALKQQHERDVQAEEAKKKQLEEETNDVCENSEYAKRQEELEEKLFAIAQKTDDYQTRDYKRQSIEAGVKAVNTVTSGIANAPVGMMSMLLAAPGVTAEQLEEKEAKNHQKVTGVVGSITGAIGGRMVRDMSRHAGELEAEREELEHQKRELIHEMQQNKHSNRCKTCSGDKIATIEDKVSSSKTDVDSKSDKDSDKAASPPNISLETLQSSKSTKKADLETGVQTHIISEFGD